MIQRRIKRGAQITSVAIAVLLGWLIFATVDHQIKKAKIPPILRTDVAPRKWEYICIHHSATNEGSAKRFDKAHRKRGMENGMAYHFVIGNGNPTGDGEIEVGKRWRKQLQGGHVKDDSINDVAIGICLVGNFTHRDPSEKQVDALVDLIVKLVKTYNLTLNDVVRHRDLGYSICPGQHFPWEEIRYRIEGELQSHE